MDWQGIQTAILNLKRRELGLPSAEEVIAERQKRDLAQRTGESNLETAGLERQKLGAEIASLPEMSAQRRALMQAQTDAAAALAEKNRREPTAKNNRYVGALDNTGAYTGVFHNENDPTDIQVVPQLKGLRPRAAPAAATGRGGLSPAAESTIINRLTTQWDKANATGRELQRQFSMMQQGLNAAKRGDSAAGSQAVLVTFQKILDPTSVVRESEYARSASGLSALSRIEGAYDRLRQGGAGVPIQDLESFANLANEFLQNSANETHAVRGRIEATAKRYGIPNDVVFGPEAPRSAPPAVPLPAAPPTATTPPGGAAGGVSVVAPNGKTYSFPDEASANAFKASAGIR